MSSKILILYTKNPAEILNRKSALGSYIHSLSNLLKDKEISVYLNGSPIDKLVPNSIESRSNSGSGFTSKLKKFIPRLLKRIKFERQLLRNSKQLIEQILTSGIEYDQVLEFYTLGSNAGKKISEKLNIPFHIVYDGPIFEEYGFFHRSKPHYLKQFQLLEKESLEAASNIVVYSEPMRQFLSDRFELKGKLHIHQNIDFSRFEQYPDKEAKTFGDFEIGFIGSFLKWHQVDLLVNVCKQLLAEGQAIKVHLIGDGQERQKLQSYVEEQGLKDQIIFTGFLDGDALFQIKKKLDVGVMPGSNWYGAPNKLFEYGAMKIAVIAPNTPTITYLFNDNEVKLFEWKNEADLLVNLRALLDWKEINKFSENIYKRIQEEYNESRTKEFYSKLFSNQPN